VGDHCKWRRLGGEKRGISVKAREGEWFNLNPLGGGRKKQTQFDRKGKRGRNVGRRGRSCEGEQLFV